jgi:hypothetical protein
LVEIILAIVLFAGVSVAIFRLSGISRRFNTETTSLAQQNVFTTLRAQIALQGLNPTAVTNLAAPVLNDPSTLVPSRAGGAEDLRNMGFARSIASFEELALVPANGANRNQWGSAQRTAINYQTPEAGGQTSKGIGFGYSIGSTGGAHIPPPTTSPLAAPSFNFSGDLTSAPFPLNGIINYPSNPPGTTYRYTTDGTAPTAVSPIWNNNPGWTVGSFPQTVTITAFNPDPQYTASAPAIATYSYILSPANFSRADGRADLYHFFYRDLMSPASFGAVLTSPVPGTNIIYTTDGSTPGPANGTFYSGPFPSDPSLFNPTVILHVIVTSGDPRYVNSPVAVYTLTPSQVPLADPVIPTDNSAPVPIGSTVSVADNDPNAEPTLQLTDPIDPGSEALSLTLD